MTTTHALNAPHPHSEPGSQALRLNSNGTVPRRSGKAPNKAKRISPKTFPVPIILGPCHSLPATPLNPPMDPQHPGPCFCAAWVA